MTTYTSDQAMDRSTMNPSGRKTELRFSSDYDGNFNFTAGLFYSDADSATDYHIQTPYMEYWADTSVGPICSIFAYSCNKGGAGFWGNFFQGLAGASAQAPGLIAAGIITSSSSSRICS